MKEDKFDRAREIKSIQSYLEELYSALSTPHPKMLTKNGNGTVCFIGLGEKYEKELKDLMKDFITKKNKELDKEFEQL